MPRLSRSRSGRPPSSLPSAPLGAHSDPLPTDPPGAAPASRRREPGSADRHPHRGRAGRFLTACARRAAAALLSGDGALRDAAPAGAGAFPATAGRDAARPARPGARCPVFAGVLASVLVGFAALLAAPQAAHAVDKEIWSATLTAAASSTLATETEFGYERAEFGTLSSEGPLLGLQAAVGARYVYSLTNNHGILGGQLQLSVDPEGTGYTDPLETPDFVKRLTLHLDASSFVGGVYAHIPNRLLWNNSGLTWTAGQTIAVRLTLDVPGIDSIAFSSSPATGTTYDTGESVSATVTFDEAVDVTGTPQLTINMGGSDKVLDYSSGTGSAALVFSGYTVAFGDTDADGLSIAANKLDVNGGTIKATTDENPDADLTHGAVAASSSHKVDGATAPPPRRSIPSRSTTPARTAPSRPTTR